MTLTELRYVVAVAQERHFGRAAAACHVSQPTLSMGVKKLENELGAALFERGQGEVTVTPIGEAVIEQAQRVLEDVARLRELADTGRDPLAGPLRLGAIYTIGPYLLPKLIPRLRRHAPAMQLLIQENFTHRLAESLKRGEVDVIVIAFPFDAPGIVTQALYDEPFFVALPHGHPWEKKRSVTVQELTQESLLLLGEGHCLRDQVLDVCHAASRAPNRSGLARALEGGSLETIRQMVASGVGLTVLPATSVYGDGAGDLICARPFARPAPYRRVALAWRRSFPRPQAIEALRAAILACDLPHVLKLPQGVAA